MLYNVSDLADVATRWRLTMETDNDTGDLPFDVTEWLDTHDTENDGE